MKTINSELLTSNQMFNDDITLAQNGDQQAFARIIDQTRNLVSSIALSIVKDLDSSEDVAQQVFIGAWNNLSDLKKTSSFLPWLRQMTRYKAINFLRDNKAAKKIEGEEADLILSQFCDPELDIDNNLQREQSNVILQEFINQLPDESREIVLLYYREEQSSQHVAQLLEQTEANIRKKLSRVRQLLHKQILQKHGRLLLSTAPALGFSSMIVAAITTSTPAAAAAISSGAVGAKSSLMHKLGLLLSGSLIGALVAVFAVRLSTIPLLKKLTNQQSIQQVLNYRKTMTFWIIFGGILLALGYEFTQGWWGPVTAYCIFALGIMYQMNSMQKLITREFYSEDDLSKKKKSVQKIQYFCGMFGSVIGVVTGFACLVFDLISDGRM